jgi:hypothetical protein
VLHPKTLAKPIQHVLLSINRARIVLMKRAHRYASLASLCAFTIFDARTIE